MCSDVYMRSFATNLWWFSETNTCAAVSSEFFAIADIFSAAAVANATELTGEFQKPITFARNAANNTGFSARSIFNDSGHKICINFPLSVIFGVCSDICTVFRGVTTSWRISTNQGSEFPKHVFVVFNRCSSTPDNIQSDNSSSVSSSDADGSYAEVARC
ncbi:hypothetical protein CHS0354_005612 [Potamilus streckersoni]|uniref:Uncharacterized protein n=1 Tax=Potamilus streckersoni TaxID=2493646 RepID=A0AAE0SID9_9BIVA|nr:hypothetical protein CHS0354_005612 [Potamilus streckersoni]